MRAIKLLAALALAVCTGCAGLGKYAKDRGNDFLDCFTALGGFGIGSPDVELHATDCLTTGAGYAYHTDDGFFREMGSGPRVQEQRRPIEALDVHGDVTAALPVGPSFRLGFSPGQFADFLLGFFGLDIAGDDETAKAAGAAKGGKQ